MVGYLRVTLSKDIKSFFTSVSSAAEAIPTCWIDNPLPRTPKRRKVGRPLKEELSTPPRPTTPSPTRRKTAAESPVQSPGRGKYKNRHSIKE